MPSCCKPIKSSLPYQSLALLVVVLMSLCLLPVHTAYAKSPKIAVADNLAALLQSQEAKVLLQKLKDELSQDRGKIEAIDKKIKSLNEKAERDGPVMSQNQRDKMIKQIEDESIDRNFLVQKFQKRQQEGQQEIVAKMKPKFQEAMKQVVEKGGYDLVLHKQALVYSAAAFDITQEITQALDKIK